MTLQGQVLAGRYALVSAIAGGMTVAAYVYSAAGSRVPCAASRLWSCSWRTTR